MVPWFIDINKDAFGVEPICAVFSEHGIKIAPSTCCACKSCTPSARTVRDTGLGEEIRRVLHDRELGRDLVGARKVWRLLRRPGAFQADCPLRRGAPDAR